MFSVSKMKKTIVKNSSLKKTFFILIVFVATILLHTINKQILWTKVNQNTRHFVKSIKGARAVKITSANKECKSVVWNNAPSLSIMCRGYHGSVMEFYNIFLVGYNLFWPKDQWPNSDLVVVLDDDSELDHRLGTVLASLPPYPNVYFETIPQQETFCSGDRRAGYSRQQYSNFYSDLYTDKDYVGIVDTDTYFQGPVVPENLFVDGKPRIVGYITILFSFYFIGLLGIVSYVMHGSQITASRVYHVSFVINQILFICITYIVHHRILHHVYSPLHFNASHQNELYIFCIYNFILLLFGHFVIF